MRVFLKWLLITSSQKEFEWDSLFHIIILYDFPRSDSGCAFILIELFELASTRIFQISFRSNRVGERVFLTLRSCIFLLEFCESCNGLGKISSNFERGVVFIFICGFYKYAVFE